MPVSKILFILATLWPGCQGATWTEDLQPDTTVYACAGGTLTLPWRLQLGQGDSIVDIQWFYSGRSQEMIAVVAHDNFLSMPAFSGRVSRTSNAGLAISGMTSLSGGNYTVEVVVREAGSSAVTTLSRSASVLVSDGLQTVDGELQAEQVPGAEYDQSTEDFHVVLRCGTFSFITQPPYYVEWTTPSGANVPSSYYKNGAFFLTLPSRVETGNYTCTVPASSACLHGSAAHTSVSVDKTDVRLAVLEYRLANRTSPCSGCGASDNLTQQVSALETRNSALERELASLKTENRALRGSLDSLSRSLNASVSRAGQLEAEMDAVRAGHGVLTARLRDLQTRDNASAVRATAMEAELAGLRAGTDQLRGEVQAMRTSEGANVTQSQLLTLRDDLTAVTQDAAAQAADLLAVKNQVTAVQADTHRLTALRQKRVSFHAQMTGTHSHYSSGDIIVMAGTRNNEGGAYNTTTGIFTVPYPGVYCFIFNAAVRGRGHQVGLNLEVDHMGGYVDNLYMYTRDFDAGGGEGSLHAVLHLQAGQQVWVRSNGVSDLNTGSDAVFSGFLVSADDAP